MAQQINVLHLSTHNEECGIAKYQQQIVDGMGNVHPINNVFFDVSPNKLKVMVGEEREKTLQKLYDQVKDFDILHIQHEPSFYHGDELELIVSHVKELGKKVMITVHTAPHAYRASLYPTRAGLGPRSWLHYGRQMKDEKVFRYNHILPMQQADLIITPNQATKESLQQYGVPAENVMVIDHPIPPVATGKKSTAIADNLHKKAGDIIFATVGFPSENKGVLHAVKALQFLPDNYKLAVIGGSHPSGQNDGFIDVICDTVAQLGLQDRFHLTGYLPEDADLDAAIREVDICVYPYNRVYYGYVSSAALSNAIASEKPVVAYPTRSLLETDKHQPFINFCKAGNYYELARTLKEVDLKASAKRSQAYAEAYSLEKQSAIFAQQYQKLVAE